MRARSGGATGDALEQSDTWRRQGRAERITWLSQHQVAYGVISGPMDLNLDRGVGNFKIAIQRAADNNVFPSDLLSRADGLRKIRNPFSHRRAPGDPDSFGSRFLSLNHL